MTPILTVSIEQAHGLRRFIMWVAKRRYGIVPGMLRVLLPDLTVCHAVDKLYGHLHLRKSSPMTRLQREMLAVVVNGKNGGAPSLGLHAAALRRLTGDDRVNSSFAIPWTE